MPNTSPKIAEVTSFMLRISKAATSLPGFCAVPEMSAAASFSSRESDVGDVPAFWMSCRIR